MSCQHEWIRISKNWRDYVCSKCDMDLSVDEYEALAQARREGWEQAKREAEGIALNQGCFTCEYCKDIEDAIAAMKYKEKAND